MLRDFISLFLVESRSAWMLVLLLLIQFGIQLYSERQRLLRSKKANPPWFRDNAYTARVREQAVLRLYVALLLVGAVVWANAGNLGGIVRLIFISFGGGVLLMAAKDLSTSGGPARVLARLLFRLVGENMPDLQTMQQGATLAGTTELSVPQDDQAPSTPDRP